MSSQLASEEMKKFIAETSEQLKGAFDDLLLPDSTPRLDVGESQKKRTKRIDTLLVLYSLRELKTKQDSLLSSKTGDVSVNDSDIPPQPVPSDLAATSETAAEGSRSSSVAVIENEICLEEMQDSHMLEMTMRTFAREKKFKELNEVRDLDTLPHSICV